MKKVICYVDGFNLYHATKELPYPDSSNVNLWSLAKSFLRDDQELIAVHYFSAYAQWKPSDKQKHIRYVKALKKSGVTVTLAHFKKKHKQCKNCKCRWVEHEEKETDVRIALQILEDAIDDKFDTAFIISGDSDMVPVVEAVKRRCPNKRIMLALPKHRFKYAYDMRRATHGQLNLALSRIKKHLF